MSETVQFMMISQIRENPVHTVDDVIGIQIPILRLCCTDDIDCFISSLFQFGIGMINQGIAYCLNPLGKITVLKYTSVKFIRVRIRRILR